MGPAGALERRVRGVPIVKGQVLNPLGVTAPKKPRVLSEKLLALLGATSLQGRPLPEGLDVADLIVLRLVRDAMRGVPSARREVFERTEGRVPERIEFGDDTTLPPDFEAACERVYGSDTLPDASSPFDPAEPPEPD